MMKKYQRNFLFPIICLLLLSAFAKDDKPTIWLIGDSTMSIKENNKFPETGWGVPFATFFKNIEVKNLAKNGRSTRSFIHEGLWNAVDEQLKPGDYLFIQFGHNDEKIEKPTVGTDISTYKANLAMFIRRAREKKAEPILLTPIVRRYFENSILVDTHREYPEAMRAVADSLGVSLIDLTEKTGQLLSKLGEKRSKMLFLHLKKGHRNYPKGVEDNTHLNTKGAYIVAELVANEIAVLDLGLNNSLK